MKALTYVDCTVLFISGVAAIALSIVKTPVVLWLPAWVLQVVALGFAIARRDGMHWPSTVFGVIAAMHVVSAIVLLAIAGVSFDGLMMLFFGLLFVHGILYLIAAKPFLIRRGWLKPKNA